MRVPDCTDEMGAKGGSCAASPVIVEVYYTGSPALSRVRALVNKLYGEHDATIIFIRVNYDENPSVVPKGAYLLEGNTLILGYRRGILVSTLNLCTEEGAIHHLVEELLK